MNNSTAPPRLIDVDSPLAVVSTPPASQLNSTLLVIINANSPSATGSRMNNSTALPRLIDVDSPPTSDSTPRARPKPPSYVPRSTFDMTELLPVLDKITITESNAQTSPLFKLPPELRNKIFSHILGGHEIRFNPTNRNFQLSTQNSIPLFCLIDSPSPPPATSLHDLLNLTLVSRQIYTETAMLPFSANTFIFTGPSELVEKAVAQMFLPAQKDAIATVKCRPGTVIFDFYSGPVADRHCLHTFSALKGLKRMVIAVRGIRMVEMDKKCLREKIGEKYEGVDIVVEETSLPREELGAWLMGM